MTSATDELRRMLDERGVEWIDIPCTDFKRTCWKSSAEQAGYFYYDEYDSGVTNLEASQLAPAQAIAATLGAGTCHETMIDRFFRGCSECGYMWEYMYGIGRCQRPNYCPNCGRKVVDDG